MTVRTSSMFGAGKWRITNRSNFWVSFNKSDGSGEVYAVAAPNTAMVTVPIQLNQPYNFIPHFYRELKYNGVVIALAESDDMSQGNMVFVTSDSPTFATEIGTNSTNSPSANIKPAAFITNSFNNYSFEVYLGQNKRLSSLGIEEFVLTSGNNAMFAGLTEDTNVNQINFSTIALDRLYVKQDKEMKKNKVYKISISGTNATDYNTTVTEVSAEDFYK